MVCKKNGETEIVRYMQTNVMSTLHMRKGETHDVAKNPPQRPESTAKSVE